MTAEKTIIIDIKESLDSIKQKINEIEESNLKNLHSKDFNSLTTIELMLQEILSTNK